VADEMVLPGDADLLGLLPHTHYLGRRVEGLAFLPDGTRRSLFLIPDWDFNWQGDYIYRNPVHLPAGTRLRMEITFDNSEGNPRNPFKPPRHGRYGPSSLDEMAELWLQLLPSSPADAAKFRQLSFERVLRDTLAANRERLRINPKDAAAHVNLGRVLLAQRRTDDAAAEFRQAVDLAPNLDDAHYYLGLIHRLAGRSAEAIAEFTRAVEINPRFARAHGNLGLVLVEGEQVEPAVRHFELAVGLDPNDQIALATLGAIRLQQGRAKDAEPLLARALVLAPNDEDVRRALAEARQLLAAPAGAAPQQPQPPPRPQPRN